jgi:S1-C subfamily serine protease
MLTRRRPASGVYAGLLSCAALAAALALTGCAGLAPKPPDERSTQPPKVHKINRQVILAASRPLPTLISQSLRRRAERLVVRVRNVSCGGVGLGSGFALDEHTLITNRHVLAGASRIEVSTWDGHTLRGSTDRVGALVDMGIASVSGTLPSSGAADGEPRAGMRVTVVGFPLGGPLTFSPGRIVDFVPGWETPGRVMRLTAHVEPGSSGSPVLDDQGRVVGIVYAYEVATGLGLAIPIDTLRNVVQHGGYERLAGWGSG